eukprot:1149640-Pelagomonas_calceolata.AAC.4
MCGIKETYDNGCCLYTPCWLQEQTIKQLKEAEDRPSLLRTWRLVDLYQYLDFWTPLAPHLVTPAKKKRGVVAEPAGGFQYAKERYTAEIGKISTSMVGVVKSKQTCACSSMLVSDATLLLSAFFPWLVEALAMMLVCVHQAQSCWLISGFIKLSLAGL